MANGTRPYVNGQVWDAIDANEVAGPSFHTLSGLLVADVLGIMAFSATDFVGYNGTNTGLSADAGVTWANVTTDLASMTGPSDVLEGSATTGLISEAAGNEVSFTTDNGDNWVEISAAGTAPSALTACYGISYPAAAVAVLGGAVSSGNSIYVSTDPATAAGSWAVATTGPTVSTVAIDMFDSTTGFAVDSSNNLWKTTNSGVDWTDTTANVAATSIFDASIISTSATTGVYLTVAAGNSTIVSHWSGTTRTDKIRFTGNAGTKDMEATNLAQTTNGNIYFVTVAGSRDQNTVDFTVSATLWRSIDDGVTWGMTSLPIGFWDFVNYETNATRSSLVEFGTDRLLWINNGGQLLKIDLNGGVS